MDYREIDQVMLAKSLSMDSAFQNVNIVIEPIPRTNGCPLGLYYPDTATVILPPDATEGALLHELGHRHAHYHYDDLSERAAENFRKRYQRGRALLYLGNDFNKLPNFGNLFEEGERGAVEVALLQPLTSDELQEIKSQLYSYRERPNVYYGNSEPAWIRVEFTKGVDWLVIIGAVMAGTIVAGVGAIGYAIYKTAEATPWVVPVTLAGVGAAFLLRAALRQEKIKARLPV